jgi:chromate reductase
MIRVLGISGSLREESHNSRLLRAAAHVLPHDAELVVWEGLKAVPPYDQDDDVEPAPHAVEALRAAIADADAVLFATPEYNSSVPGQLKNAVDWASRPLATNPLRNTPVAVVGASTGMFGAVWAQAELRKTLAATGARVIPGDLALGKASEASFDEDGALVDADLAEAYAGLVGELVFQTTPAAARQAA